MSHRPYPPSEPLLFGYDPAIDIPSDHLARLVDQIVEEVVPAGAHAPVRGRPAFDLRLCIKVLVFGYSTGVRSSRQLERLCHEHLAYLFLTRGDTPCYRTLCSVRTAQEKLLEEVWLSLFGVAGRVGLKRLGKITIDSSKFRADAGGECVLGSNEYDRMLEVLQSILKEADQVDRKEDEEGGGPGTRLEKEVPRDQMRDIIRAVRSRLSDKNAPGGESPAASSFNVTVRMMGRIKEGIDAIKSAQTEGRKHLCLTDPDARMMGEGASRRIKECYSFEIAVDAGLIVAGQATQSCVDNDRLLPIVEAASLNEPGGIISVDADSGYFSGDGICTLHKAGVDTCIPDAPTACDIHRGDAIGTTRQRQNGTVAFSYEEEANRYVCPEGNALEFLQTRKSSGKTVHVYVASRECTGCKLASECMKHKGAKRREIQVGVDEDIIRELRQAFSKPEHIERYGKRGPAVETVFGFIRSNLGYHRWSLRGNNRVACEAKLFKIGYQIRKILPNWRTHQSVTA